MEEMGRIDPERDQPDQPGRAGERVCTLSVSSTVVLVCLPRAWRTSTPRRLAGWKLKISSLGPETRGIIQKESRLLGSFRVDPSAVHPRRGIGHRKRGTCR